MAGIYSVTLASATGTSAAALFDAKAGANVGKIMEFGTSTLAATSSLWGLFKSSNNPVQTTPTLVQAENYADVAGTTNCTTAWTTAPTFGTVGIREWTTGNTIAAGVVWTFPRGLGLPTGGPTVALINRAASSIGCAHWVVVEEP